MMHYGWDGGWSVFWMILWWIAVVAIVVLMVGAFTREPSPAVGSRDPLGILDERYARGEISEEEYQERHRVLEGARR
jgi:putative membrane protein